MEWLVNLLDTLTSIFPRLSFIKNTDEGVLFYGENAYKKGPGYVFWWPIISELYVIPVVRQTQQLKAQTLVTKDREPVTVSVTIRFEIDDIMLACVKTYDFMDTIEDIAQGEVAVVIRSFNYDEITEDIDKILSRRIRSKLKPYGVALRKAFIAEFSPCTPIRLWQMNS